MKKIFLIGKFSPDFEEKEKFLSRFFKVQICVDNVVMMKSLLNIEEPDIFIFDQTEYSEEKINILHEIRKTYPSMPLICIDNPNDPTALEDVMGIKTDNSIIDVTAGIKNSRILTAPISNEDLIVAVCDFFGLEFNKQDQAVYKKMRGGKPCVLVVDDVAFQLRAVNELLKDEFAVMVATSASMALTMIAKRVPDIILLDYEMPICDGRQAMQMIKEVQDAKDVPIVFLTAHGDMDHIKSVLELKPAGYLLKPVNKETLKAEIRKHI
ncbi:MAG: response regulator [Oscillospiraceae bacterium]|nr:response regulator [Oscillospiraceae bacterium]